MVDVLAATRARKAQKLQAAAASDAPDTETPGVAESERMSAGSDAIETPGVEKARRKGRPKQGAPDVPRARYTVLLPVETIRRIKTLALLKPYTENQIVENALAPVVAGVRLGSVPAEFSDRMESRASLVGGDIKMSA